MKLRLPIICIALLLVASSTFGQLENISVIKGDIQKDKKKNTSLLFTVEDGKGGVFILRQFLAGLIKTPKGYYLEHYNSDLELINNKDLEIENSAIKNIMVRDSQLHLIEYRRNNETNTNDYNVLSADINDLNFKSKTLFSISRDDVKKPFMFAIGLIPFTNMGSVDHDPTGEVKFSENKEFLAFNFDIKQKDEETHRLVVYDKDLNLIYDKNITEDISDRYFAYNSFTVDNTDGSVYFLGKAYGNETLKNKYMGEINYKFNIYKVNKENTRRLVFDTDEHFISSLEVLNKNNKVFCVGSYSDKNASRNLGIAYFNLNSSDLTIDKTTFNPFTEEFLTDKYGEKKGKRKKSKNKELSNFVFRDYFLDDDENLYFSAEEFYITVSTMMNANGGSNTSTIYHYRDIYVCKINGVGEFQWLRTINKSQATSYPRGYLSFVSALVDNEMIILLNGSENVAKLKDDRIAFKQSKRSKLNLYAIKVGANGNFDYEIIIPEDKTNITYKTQYGVASKDKRSIILEGNRKKEKQVVKVQF